MPLLNNVSSIIRFSVLLGPTIIMGGTLWDTFVNPSWKGPIFILGALLTTILGKILSSSLSRKVPGFRQDATLGRGGPIREGQMFDPACNLIMRDAGGWGTFYSSPESHALFFAYAIIYLITGMFLTGQPNWLLFGVLLAITAMSGYIRTNSPLLCAGGPDLFFGYIIGMICGGFWYFCIYALENMANPPLDLTYFNKSKGSDAERCNLANKKFVCKKTKK